MAMATQAVMKSINPATEEVLGRFPLFSDDQVDRALDSAQWAFHSWSETTFEERAERLRRAAEYLRTNRARLAGLITLEMGKPIAQSEAEIEKCAWNCDYYADNARQFLADQPRPSSAAESYVTFDPLGPVLAIMPWNFPFWQLFRFAAPTLMAGNTALLKHASNVPRCSLAIEEVFRASGFPEGVFQTLLVSGTTADKIITDPRIAAVTVTGSNATGRKVSQTAGAVTKKSVLELGGSDPFIVLEDAELEEAARVAVRSRYQNSGQSCIAAKRFIVVEAVADAFLDRMVAEATALKMGDPTDRATDIGPLARGDLRDVLARQVSDSVGKGARVLLGGYRPRGAGFFYAPTILADIRPDMPVFREETFGPVAAVLRVPDVDEAIRLANDSLYGLGSDLWTRDLERAKAVARRIQSGSVFINGMVASDPRLPFGGVKGSGYGRELSELGIREFTNVKTVWIGPSAEKQPQWQPAE
ncbi:MAG: NAD-dependent succinate-semialdehyde dehydrogenase [Chloroflexota bacterium]